MESHPSALDRRVISRVTDGRTSGGAQVVTGAHRYIFRRRTCFADKKVKTPEGAPPPSQPNLPTSIPSWPPSKRRMRAPLPMCAEYIDMRLPPDTAHTTTTTYYYGTAPFSLCSPLAVVV